MSKTNYRLYGIKANKTNSKIASRLRIRTQIFETHKHTTHFDTIATHSSGIQKKQ